MTVIRSRRAKWALLAVGVAFTVCVVTVVVSQAQQQRTPTLTALDYEEIRQLMHRYMFYLDNCPGRNNGLDYADLFTEDGKFYSGGSVVTGQARQGRDGLASVAGWQQNAPCRDTRTRGPRNQIHINMGEIIEPSPEGARATSYLMMIDGPGGQIYWDGWYEDILVKTPNGWRFKQRYHANDEVAGIPPAAIAARAKIREVSHAMPPSTRPVSREPVKWVDGLDNRTIEQAVGAQPR